jgi:ribosomal protein S27AE
MLGRSPSSGAVGRARSSANLGRRRDIAAEQTAMMDIARTDFVECPRCGAANYDNASRCAECGYVLLISCPRCGLVNRTGTMQCGRCGLFLSQPTGAPRTGAYGVAAPVSRPLPHLATDLPRIQIEPSDQRPLGRWILTTLVALALVCALIVALAEGFQPVNDTIASLTHIDIHATISGIVDLLLGLLPH